MLGAVFRGSSRGLHMVTRKAVRPFSSLNGANSVLFPDENPGNDYATNWAVASCGVAVSGSAYRNFDGLKSLAKKGKGGGKADLLVDVDADIFTDIAEDTCAALSGVETLYLNDGETKDSVKVRAVTDDATFAYSVEQLLGAETGSAQNFNAAVKIIHSSVDDKEASGPYVAVSNGKVIVRGSVSSDIVAKGVAEASK